MNVMEINACNFGSTGNIMLQIAEKARTAGHTVFTVCPDSRDNRKKQVAGQMLIGSRLSRNFHRVGAMITGREGMFSRSATAALIREMKKLDISLIHLHNLHGWYINLPMLFRYIKKNNVRVIWTLHDCWSFTGHCTYFDIYRCERWKTGCGDCPQRKNYPKSLFFDRSARNFELKKRYCATLPDLTLVPPSKWIGGLLEQSLFAEGPARIRVINNGIDLNSFSPTPSNFREKNGLEGKKILLGVANPWGERKGLDDFLYLREHLGEEYAIVLVGLSPEQRDALPEGILGILRTNSVKELAQIYTAADIFLNPTYEDNYPTVNMEAQACGTPVITYRTGGSPENVDPASGMIVERGDRAALLDAVQRFLPRPVQGAECFDKNLRFREYIELYRELCGEK